MASAAPAPHHPEATPAVASTPWPTRPSAQPAATQFRLLTPEESGVAAAMQLPDPERFVREYTLLIVYGGLCVGDYDGDGWCDFFATSPGGGSRLYRNLGGLKFADVTDQAGLNFDDYWAVGATFVDIDDDGDLDLSVCGYGVPNRIYINQGPDAAGDVRFVERAAELGLDFVGSSMTIAYGDIDNDGDLDAYLATTAREPPPGTKFAVKFEGGKPVVLDELREYWQLIYLPGERAHRTEAGQFDHLYRNDGGRFVEITGEAGIDGPYFTLSAIFWDYNRDGWPDIYVANDYSGPDLLYRNNGDGTFTDVHSEVLPQAPWFSMGTDVADVNNDGLVDLLTTDMAARDRFRGRIMTGALDENREMMALLTPRQVMRNALFLNSGNDRMLEAAWQAQVARTDWTWNPRLADLDNDGRVDLFVTTGVLRDTMNSDTSVRADQQFSPGSDEWRAFWAAQPMYPEQNLAFQNFGDLAFRDVSAAWGLDRVGVSFGAASADFDNDGDLDLVVNNADAPISVYENQATAGASVRIQLRGRTSNRFGIGAVAVVEAGDLRQAQQMTLARGWLSGGAPELHFGLGEAQRIETLTVRWPSGVRQTLRDLAVDALHVIAEPDAQPEASSDAPPNPFYRRLAQDDPPRHAAVDFDDFSEQALLPFRLSTRGPIMAWGDVDGDGDLDAYLGGDAGQPGQLLLNESPRGLRAIVPDCLAADRACADGAACWVDIDGDGDLDLVVASGGVQRPDGDEAYRLRIYENQDADAQRGVQLVSYAAAPRDVRLSAGAVAASDFDRDGDVDLFVGGRSVPGRYPLAPPSRLLVREGDAWVERTPPELAAVGVTTDAAWVDLDRNGWDDLVVATEWGPLRVFLNADGVLRDATAEWGLSGLQGWWTSLAIADFDGDGWTDVAAGNLGLNTPYQVDADRPALLYYGDFDGSGVSHVLEGVVDEGRRYPRRSMASLKQAMFFFAEDFPTHHQFAAATLEELCTPERLAAADQRQINVIASGVFWNEQGARLQFAPLPAAAQTAPGMDLTTCDANGDGRLDLALAQNFAGANPELGVLTGGVGAVALGLPQRQWQTLWPSDSGVVVPGEGRAVAAVDVTGDGRADLVFGVRGAPVLVFERQP